MNEVSKCHRCNWLQSLKSEGLKPTMIYLETLPDESEWQEVEKEWIAIGREIGWPLTNNTDGGDGVSGLPEETREKMRKTWLGRKHKPESIEKMRKGRKGRKHTEEHKEKMSSLMKGRDITWGDALSKANRKLSEEDQQKILDMLSDGWLVKDIAEHFNVHRTTISKVKKGIYHKKYRDMYGESNK